MQSEAELQAKRTRFDLRSRDELVYERGLSYIGWSLHILASGLRITQQSSAAVHIPLAPQINQTAMFDRKVLSLSPQALRPISLNYDHWSGMLYSTCPS